jgi:Leucine-rich repeat (LRR) protein
MSLSRLVAANNLITIVDISLPSLVELDLSRNYLSEIPPLQGLVNLETLLLTFNEISGGYQELRKA